MHQRQKQLTDTLDEVEAKLDEKTKNEIKSEKTSDKPEPPKVDPEKTRQVCCVCKICCLFGSQLILYLVVALPSAFVSRKRNV